MSKNIFEYSYDLLGEIFEFFFGFSSGFLRFWEIF